jgi:hypothetical protein
MAKQWLLLRFVAASSAIGESDWDFVPDVFELDPSVLVHDDDHFVESSFTNEAFIFVPSLSPALPNFPLADLPPLSPSPTLESRPSEIDAMQPGNSDIELAASGEFSDSASESEDGGDSVASSEVAAEEEEGQSGGGTLFNRLRTEIYRRSFRSSSEPTNLAPKWRLSESFKSGKKIWH